MNQKFYFTGEYPPNVLYLEEKNSDREGRQKRFYPLPSPRNHSDAQLFL